MTGGTGADTFVFGQGHTILLMTILLMGVDTEHLIARAESVFTFA